MKFYNQRESWKSRIGFISAALGSAVGLGSIWRFPYVVGQNGGGAFILLYVIFLILIGFPILVSEIVIGRTAQSSPYGSFRILGRNKIWANFGKLSIFTGFIISSFYSVIAGWMLGYLIEAIFNNLHFTSSIDALNHFHNLSSNPFWSVGFHFIFMMLSILILFFGVRKGIEAKSKIMMPLLFLVLLILVIKGISMPNSFKGIKFLFSFNFKQITPAGILIALGQAFFTLSLGQGTMITYGSYLSRKEDIVRSCFPVVLLNTIIAILMGVAIFTIVFSNNLQPQAGPALIFETLPIVFSNMKFGTFVGILFFTLASLAALTSEISALEPIISYLIDEKGFSRKKASIFSGSLAFLIGIPSALAFGLFKNYKIFGENFFDIISFLSVNILVPIGGLLAVLLVGYRWGMKEAFDNMKVDEKDLFHHKSLLKKYFYFSIKFISPILIVLIILNLIGIF
ncbi:MAG: sodium-dependent transporter [Parachlamydiales bacterium]|nr:sodium-dependent transporter [Parachlamydiales bacterium]